MMDEMAIRKHVEYSAGKFHGYVDLEALLTTACHQQEMQWFSWLLLLTNLQRILRLPDVGVHTVPLTCDGPSCHFSMLKTLGVNLDINSMRPSFPNPANSLQDVHVILDVCHMMKLLRTTLAEGGSLQTPRGKIK